MGPALTCVHLACDGFVGGVEIIVIVPVITAQQWDNFILKDGAQIQFISDGKAIRDTLSHRECAHFANRVSYLVPVARVGVLTS